LSTTKGAVYTSIRNTMFFFGGRGGGHLYVTALQSGRFIWLRHKQKT